MPKSLKEKLGLEILKINWFLLEKSKITLDSTIITFLKEITMWRQK